MGRPDEPMTSWKPTYGHHEPAWERDAVTSAGLLSLQVLSAWKDFLKLHCRIAQHA